MGSSGNLKVSVLEDKNSLDEQQEDALGQDLTPKVNLCEGHTLGRNCLNLNLQLEPSLELTTNC